MTLLTYLKTDLSVAEKAVGLAPMAGISDLPFRKLCSQLGASFTVTEMVSADPKFRGTTRNALRLDLSGNFGPKIVQIAGAEPQLLADAALMAADYGADVVDINMGCPAKKVCKKLAGSALMKDEQLVGRLLEAVRSAVDLPVTVKMRTGWDKQNKNAAAIAVLAEEIGVSALTIHGRTRACRFKGVAEYDTIKAVKQSVGIPVIANGDITTPMQALEVLTHTGCDGLMIGRGAVGNPWLFGQIKNYLNTGDLVQAPSSEQVLAAAAAHLSAMHDHYGDLAVKLVRKHMVAYSALLTNGIDFKNGFNRQTTQNAQQQFVMEFANNNNNGALAA
ncbi:MAG: tRNA dihydrouridine synthase DusB [Pseudomonadota bacterium]